MKRIYECVLKHYTKFFWRSVAFIGLYLIALMVIAFTPLEIPESFLLFVGLLLIYAIPACFITLLSLVAVVQVFQQKRTVKSAIGHVSMALVVDVLFIIFFFILILGIFGFS